MVLEEMNSLYNPWTLLQQPAHPGKGLSASFRTLLAAIDQGWQVEGPVMVYPPEGGKVATYCFTLLQKNLAQTCRIFIPVIPEVKRFIFTNNYQETHVSL